MEKILSHPDPGGECYRIGGTKLSLEPIDWPPHSIDSAIAYISDWSQVTKRN